MIWENQINNFFQNNLNNKFYKIIMTDNSKQLKLEENIIENKDNKEMINFKIIISKCQKI